MLVILGDIHFRDDKEYFRTTCTDFLNWFKTWQLNNSNNTLLLAGDLVESSLLTGTVVDYLEKFYNYSNFKEIHICVGNHDKKTINNISQLAYEFYLNKPNVFAYFEATEKVIENKNVLFLPYYLDQNSLGLSMTEYYSSISENPNFKNNYDLVLGHFSGEDFHFQGSTDIVYNLDKINTKKICLGHIHTRDIDPNKYIGSVFAGKKGENDYTRAAWYLSGNTWKEDKLPNFNEFCTVFYPEPLPEKKAITPIYTILNCGNEVIAKEKYGNIAIRKVLSRDSENLGKVLNGFDDHFSSIKNLNVSELFSAFIKTKTLSNKVIEECKAALGIA